jgi:hypothetical protein
MPRTFVPHTDSFPFFVEPLPSPWGRWKTGGAWC